MKSSCCQEEIIRISEDEFLCQKCGKLMENDIQKKCNKPCTEQPDLKQELKDYSEEVGRESARDCEEQPAEKDWEEEFDKEFDTFEKWVNVDRLKQFIYTQIAQAEERGAKKERERVKKNIGALRQFLNERVSKELLTSKEIEIFLIN